MVSSIKEGVFSAPYLKPELTQIMDHFCGGRPDAPNAHCLEFGYGACGFFTDDICKSDRADELQNNVTTCV